jgi:predicted nicotinamide N-methyase
LQEPEGGDRHEQGGSLAQGKDRTVGRTSEERRRFILENTRLQRPAHVPELQLYLADEIEPIWRTIQGEQTELTELPYWAFAWVGGQAVARYLLDRAEEAAGNRALDFGAGSGLCALAAMRAGAASAMGADIDPFSREATGLNAAANGMRVGFTDRDLLEADPPECDLILAGDICYERRLATRVVAWLATAHARGIRVLIGDPGRPYFPRDGLIQLAEYEMQTTRELEDAAVKPAGVHTFRPR